MRMWWKKLGGKTVEAGGRASASEVEAEYSRFVSRIHGALVPGALVAVLGVVVIYLVSWMSSVSAAQQRLALMPRKGPELVLAPLPSDLIAVGFSLLAAFAIALQLAVRTPSEAEARPAIALARRRFLCRIANVIVLAAFALATYVTIPVLLAGPQAIDVLRLFAPASGGILVALVAADAGVAADPDFAPSEISRVSRARAAVLLLRGLRLVGSPAERPHAGAMVWQTIVLVSVPVLIALVSGAFVPDNHFRQQMGLVLIATTVAAVMYTITVRVYVSAITRDWMTVFAIIALTAPLVLLFWMAVVGVMLERAAPTRSLSLAASTAAWGIIYIVVPVFLAMWSLAPRRGGRPRLLGYGVGLLLVRRLRRRHKGLERPAGPPHNRLAATAPWVSPVLPFGLILGVIAKQQIAQANRPPALMPQRGTGAANLAIALTIILFFALVVGLFLIAATNPREWNDYMWG